MRYTTDQLIAAVKSNAGIPSSQRRFTNSDIMRFLNEELELTIVARLLELQQDYFVQKENTTLLANTSEYAFPDRAIGWKVNTVGYREGTEFRKLPRISRSQRGMYSDAGTSSSPSAFYINNDKLVLIPNIGTSPTGSLEIDFVRIQSELVANLATATITSWTLDPAAYAITVSNAINVDNGVDIIEADNPFSVYVRKSTPIGVVGNIIYLPIADLIVEPKAGDYVCPYKQTCIPLIPEDFHPALALAGTIRTQIHMHDTTGAQATASALQNMLNSMISRAVDRVESSPIKLVSKNTILNMMR